MSENQKSRFIKLSELFSSVESLGLGFIEFNFEEAKNNKLMFGSEGMNHELTVLIYPLYDCLVTETEFIEDLLNKSLVLIIYGSVYGKHLYRKI